MQKMVTGNRQWIDKFVYLVYNKIFGYGPFGPVYGTSICLENNYAINANTTIRLKQC